MKFRWKNDLVTKTVSKYIVIKVVEVTKGG